MRYYHLDSDETVDSLNGERRLVYTYRNYPTIHAAEAYPTTDTLDPETTSDRVLVVFEHVSAGYGYGAETVHHSNYRTLRAEFPLLIWDGRHFSLTLAEWNQRGLDEDGEFLNEEVYWIANAMQALDDYPVYDDMDHSQLEHDLFEEQWADSYGLAHDWADAIEKAGVEDFTASAAADPWNLMRLIASYPQAERNYWLEIEWDGTSAWTYGLGNGGPEAIATDMLGLTGNE